MRISLVSKIRSKLTPRAWGKRARGIVGYGTLYPRLGEVPKAKVWVRVLIRAGKKYGLRKQYHLPQWGEGHSQNFLVVGVGGWSRCVRDLERLVDEGSVSIGLMSKMKSKLTVWGKCVCRSMVSRVHRVMIWATVHQYNA